MKVIDIIKNSKKPLFTFELLPPLKGHSLEVLYQNIDRLLEFDPAYINITFHQPEAAIINNEKHIIRKRPGTVAISAAVQYKYNVPVVPHIICGGHSKQELEDILIDLNFLGIVNVLALRGDGPKPLKVFVPEKGGHAHTSELIEQIINMNNGKYLDNALENPTPTNFSIGVAAYPEKHFEAVDLKTDLDFLKLKIAKGAEYIVTQLFFDNQHFFDFVKLCRDNGITVPIIPGIKPISTIKEVEVVPDVFFVDMPKDLLQAVQKCKTNQDAKAVGVEWAIEQAKGLLKYGVPGIHFYTYGMSDNVKQIASSVY